MFSALPTAEHAFRILNMRSVDFTANARIRDSAIEQWGRHGFGTSIRAIAESAGVSAALVIHHFGSKDGLRKACDDYVLELIRATKSESLQSPDPVAWFNQIATMDEYAPVMAYLVRSMQSGGALAKTLWLRMIDNAEQYLEDAVRVGTVKPSRDPHARARFLAMVGGGGFLLYLQLHDNPTDLAAVLRDYREDMVLPAIEVYTHGLLADSSMYDAIVEQHKAHHDTWEGATDGHEN